MPSKRPKKPDDDAHEILHLHQLIRGQERIEAAIVALAEDVCQLHCIGEKIMATQAEMAAEMVVLKGKITKIGNEIDGLTAANVTLQTKVDELGAIIAAGGPITPELQTSFDEVKAAAQVVDDKIPDAPTP